MRALIFRDPAFVELVEGDGIEEVELLTATPSGGDEVGVFEDFEVLGDGLTGHVEAAAEIAESLAVLAAQLIEQGPAAGIGQGFEDCIHHEE